MNVDEYAIRVQNVSKSYRLLRSPREQLFFPFKKLLSSMMPGLKKSDVEKSSGRIFFNALKNISFDIRKGESWGFIGVNGSGKSTLLKIISGNLRPSSGRVEVDGKTVILDYGSGFNGEFTGRDNIYLKATLLGLNRKQIKERFNSIVEFTEIGDFIDQPVKTYSSGMSARLGFAVMAHVDADIIITDEALAVGDVFFVQKCMTFIRDFLKKGTFLFVSHSMNDVLSLCQNAVWLEHGQIKMIGPSSVVTRGYLNERESEKEDFLDEVAEQNIYVVTDQIIKSEIVLGQPAISRLMNYEKPKFFRDARLDYPNNPRLRNDIKIDLQTKIEKGIAIRGAKIVNVSLCDEEGTPFSWIIGGEMVTFSIEVLAERDLQSPIVGFQVLDRLGQVLFADNSYILTQTQPVVLKQGTHFSAEFRFQMPLLPPGDYVVRAAVAIGEESNAIMLNTVETALAFSSVTSGVRHGLVGIPMHSIKFKHLSAPSSLSQAIEEA